MHTTLVCCGTAVENHYILIWFFKKLKYKSVFYLLNFWYLIRQHIFKSFCKQNTSIFWYISLWVLYVPLSVTLSCFLFQYLNPKNLLNAYMAHISITKEFFFFSIQLFCFFLFCFWVCFFLGKQHLCFYSFLYTILSPVSLI